MKIHGTHVRAEDGGSAAARREGSGGQDGRSPLERAVDALTGADWQLFTVEDAEPITRFEAYLREHQVKPAHLAKRSGYSRQHLLRLRLGRQEPTRRCMLALARALQSLTGDPVQATDLFDLGGK
jgi:hypothetical protein